MKLVFAPIDARDHALIAAVKQNDYSYVYGRPRSQHNTRIMNTARLEYLRDLKKLQDSIVYRFEHQLEDDSHIDPNDSFCETQCPCSSQHKKVCDTPSELSDLYYT
jgi:hypothetical protein